jgi:hypothetical protein
MYSGVPEVVEQRDSSERCLDVPKSEIFIRGVWWDLRKLAGFMSRWAMFFWWRDCKASHAYLKYI